MQKKNRYALLVTLCCCSSVASAMTQCPGNTGFVAMGDSLDQVVQTCGQPQKRIDEKPAQATSQMWLYKIPSGNNQGKRYTRDAWLTFNNKKLTAITLSAAVVVQSRQLPCQAGMVQLGDSIQRVRKTCGLPFIVRSIKNVHPGQPQQPSASQAAITRLIYKPNSYMPAKVFTFQDGKLVRIN